MTITEFCDRHHACPEGREWALANCRTMQEAWETARPNWVVWIATQHGVLDEATRRGFGLFAAGRVRHLRGEATDEELRAARDAEGDAGAARAAAWAARAAAWADAGADAGAAAQAAAWAAAWAAEWAAERAAEWAAASAAAAAAEREAQAAWLRENAKPNWEAKP